MPPKRKETSRLQYLENQKRKRAEARQQKETDKVLFVLNAWQTEGLILTPALPPPPAPPVAQLQLTAWHGSEDGWLMHALPPCAPCPKSHGPEEQMVPSLAKADDDLMLAAMPVPAAVGQPRQLLPLVPQQQLPPRTQPPPPVRLNQSPPPVSTAAELARTPPHVPTKAPSGTTLRQPLLPASVNQCMAGRGESAEAVASDTGFVMPPAETADASDAVASYAADDSPMPDEQPPPVEPPLPPQPSLAAGCGGAGDKKTTGGTPPSGGTPPQEPGPPPPPHGTSPQQPHSTRSSASPKLCSTCGQSPSGHAYWSRVPGDALINCPTCPACHMPRVPQSMPAGGGHIRPAQRPRPGRGQRPPDCAAPA